MLNILIVVSELPVLEGLPLVSVKTNFYTLYLNGRDTEETYPENLKFVFNV